MSEQARSDWEIVFFLPAISGFPGGVNEVSAGLEGIAIATPESPKVIDYLESCNVAKLFSTRFKTVSGVPSKPAAVICHRDLLESFGGDATPLVSFRNLVALSSVLPARAMGGSQGWSDLFDVHPGQVSLSGDYILVITQAETRFSAADERLDIRPKMGSPTGEPNLFDDFLLFKLAGAWEDLYVRRRNVRLLEPVFRSLEVVFHAASMSFRNFASIYDVGVDTILWISACEVLARAEGNPVNLEKVQDLLGEYSWPRSSDLHQHWYATGYRNNRRRVNRVSKLYDELYKARNDFAHGNPIRDSVLFSGALKGWQLLGLASTVYRTALAAYLTRYRPSPTSEDFPLESQIIHASYAGHLDGSQGWGRPPL